MLTVEGLIDNLKALVERDPKVAALPVAFRDEEGEPVIIAGGIVHKPERGIGGVLLSPIALDMVGGF